jgi:hypothetical protein
MQIKACSRPWAMIFGLVMLSNQARADGVQLSPVVIATAEDQGSQDGQFDAFTPLNLGSIDNNGFTSFRTALEFNFPIIPAGSTIRSVSLFIRLGFVEGARNLEIHSYPDDGVIQLEDFSRNGFAASVSLPNGISGDAYFDLTASMRAVKDTGASSFGLSLREDPTYTGNFAVFNIETSGPGAPVVTVDFAPLPECSALWLLAMAGVVVFAMRRTVNKRPEAAPALAVALGRPMESCSCSRLRVLACIPFPGRRGGGSGCKHGCAYIGVSKIAGRWGASGYGSCTIPPKCAFRAGCRSVRVESLD